MPFLEVRVKSFTRIKLPGLAALLAVGLSAGAAGLAARPKAPAKYAAPATPVKAPDKLSDLHKLLTDQVEKVFGARISIRPVVVGLSRQILSNGRIRQVDMTLGSFDYQGLHFSDGELLLDHLWMDPKALSRWEIRVTRVPESSNKLVISLPSLQTKLAQEMGGGFQMQAVVGDQSLQLSGKGRFLGLPMDYKTEAVLRYKDGDLRLVPRKVIWGYWKIPRWLWWLGRGNCPDKPVLTLPDCWIPWNIQQIHVSWDHIVLSTDW